ncbi:TniQ family protein [Acinetobacter baumannii]
MKLLHKPVPFHDEFIGSIILRLSEINGYKNPKQMLRNHGIKIFEEDLKFTFANKERIHHIINTLNLPRNYIFFSYNISSNRKLIEYKPEQYIASELISLRLDKFCPNCLESQLYWKDQWTLIPIFICPIHSIYLINFCPSCNYQLKSNRTFLHICNNCEFDLRKSKTVTANTEIIKYTNWLLNTINNNDKKLISEFQTIWIVFSIYYNKLNLVFDLNKALIFCYLYIVKKNNFIEKFFDLIKENLCYTYPSIQLLPFLRSTPELSKIARDILKKFDDPISLSSIGLDQQLNMSEVYIVLNITPYKINKLITLNQNIFNKYCKNNNITFSVKLVEELILNGKFPSNSHKSIHHPPFFNDQSDLYFDADQISKILEVDIKVVNRFLKHPNLGISRKILNFKTKNCISKKILQNFNENYILVEKLALTFQETRTILIFKLSLLDIHPAIQSNSYAIFYKKSDIENLTLSIINTLPHNQTRKIHRKNFRITSRVYYSPTDAAEILGIHVKEVEQLVESNFILANDKNQRPLKILKNSLDNFLQIKNDPSLIDLTCVLKELNFTYEQFIEIWVKAKFAKIINLGFWQFIAIEQFHYIQDIHDNFYTVSEACNFLKLTIDALQTLEEQEVISSCLFGNKYFSIKMFNKSDLHSYFFHKMFF